MPKRKRLKFKKRVVKKIEEPTPEKIETVDKSQTTKKKYEEYEKKFVRKTIRFTLEEWDKIQSQLDVHKIDFAQFAKSKLLKYKIKFPAVLKNEAENRRVKIALFAELNAIGKNINQIARKANQNEFEIQTLQSLQKIEKHLESIKEKI